MPINDRDEVAVLPELSSLTSEVLEIATVLHAGPVFIQLEDGRMHASIGGKGLNTNGCIVAARAEHRTAIDRRRAITLAG